MPSLLWERIIVRFRQQCPFEDRWPKFAQTLARSNLGTFKLRHVQTSAKVKDCFWDLIYLQNF